MARAAGYAPSTIHRIWQAFGLQPLGDVQAVIGPAVCGEGAGHCRPLSRPARAGALRRREEPGSGPLPSAASHAARRRTHDYVRHGTTTLFAALDIGRVIGQCLPPQPGVPQVPAHARSPGPRRARRPSGDGQLRNPQDARRWLARHPRWHVHFTPTGASWLNQVERFFALLTEKQLRRGVHRSTRELEQAIRNYIDTVNADPRPFQWTKSADDILATIKRFCLRTLETAERQMKITKTSESGH